MSRPPKPARYRLTSHPGITDDLAALVGFGPDVVAAARAALDDLAIGVRDEHAIYRMAVERIGAIEALNADTDDRR